MKWSQSGFCAWSSLIGNTIVMTNRKENVFDVLHYGNSILSERRQRDNYTCWNLCGQRLFSNHICLIHLCVGTPGYDRTDFCPLMRMLLLPACFPTFGEKCCSQFHLSILVKVHYNILILCYSDYHLAI